MSSAISSNKKTLSKQELGRYAKLVQLNHNLTDKQTRKYMKEWKKGVKSLGLSAALLVGGVVAMDKHPKTALVVLTTGWGISIKSLYHSVKAAMLIHKFRRKNAKKRMENKQSSRSRRRRKTRTRRRRKSRR